MSTAPMLRLFRVMRPAADGLPRLGHSASTLGVRVEGRESRCDIPVKNGLVEPSQGGMSVTPDDWRNVYFVFLENAVDDNEPDQMWLLHGSDLGPDLQYRADDRYPGSHGFIEPSRSMAVSVYEAAIIETRPRWKLYSVENEERI